MCDPVCKTRPATQGEGNFDDSEFHLDRMSWWPISTAYSFDRC